MSLLIRNFSKMNPIGTVRCYSEVVNVFGRRSVDTTGQKKELKQVIPENTESIKELTDHPEQHVSGRKVRIYIPAKNAMQSGTYSLRKWRIEFDNRERWENPLIGWGSSGDPISNTMPEFGSKEDAIIYCQRMGYDYLVDDPKTIQKRIKSYGANFSWNKRTRVSTK